MNGGHDDLFGFGAESWEKAKLEAICAIVREGRKGNPISYSDLAKAISSINIEPHGHFTTRPEFMAEMLAFVDSPYLRMNFDTGNTFIAGQDPAAFLDRFRDKVSHVHIKDVSEGLAAAVRRQIAKKSVGGHIAAARRPRRSVQNPGGNA